MRCPGQNTQFWDSEAIFEVKCPECDHPVEFFKDESSRRCRHCGARVANPRLDFGCAATCAFAEQCIGTLPPELVAKRSELLKDRVAVAMKRTFGGDFRRIAHAMKVARHAEAIAREEHADLAVVLAAAYLHDIGIKEAERLYNSSAARYQEELGPPIARDILNRLGAPAPLIDEVCDIVGHHHHPRMEETVNFKCLYDADLIVNREENAKEQPVSPGRATAAAEKGYLTEAGRRLARTVFAAEGAEPVEEHRAEGGAPA